MTAKTMKRAGRILALAVFLGPPVATAQSLPLNPFGIQDSLVGRPAPEWDVDSWTDGRERSLRDYRGKVVILEFFQMWCPGCKKFSLPLMKEWEERYSGRKDIAFLSVHTVFEGHSSQTPTRLRKFLKKRGITRPVAVDRHGEDEEIPETMKRYRTGGTPCLVIVDKEGMIRFKWLGGFNKTPVQGFLDELLVEGAREARVEFRP